VGLQVHVLDPRGGIRLLVDDVGGLEARLDTADLAVDVDEDVAIRLAALVVEDWRARLHGHLGVEDGREDLVLDLQEPAGRLGGRDRLRDDRGHPLTDEADDVVEDVRVVRIHVVILVGRGAVEPAGDVLPGEDRDHSGQGHGPVAPDAHDAGVCVW
jgi:hypothetical protein